MSPPSCLPAPVAMTMVHSAPVPWETRKKKKRRDKIRRLGEAGKRREGGVKYNDGWRV